MLGHFNFYKKGNYCVDKQLSDYIKTKQLLFQKGMFIDVFEIDLIFSSDIFSVPASKTAQP